MKKILRFEVEEGNTVCDISCPFYPCDDVSQCIKIDCRKYDYSTLKFIDSYEEDT